MDKILYTPTKDISLPHAFFKVGEIKTKEQWLKYMPVSLHSEFNYFFVKFKSN